MSVGAFSSSRWADRLRDWSSRDFFPDTSRVVRRWVKNPLAVLIYAAIVAALSGIVLHPHGFVVAAGLIALIGVGLAWPWMAVRGLGGSLGFQQARAREGEPVPAYLYLRNRAPWGAIGLSITEADSELSVGVAAVGGVRQLDFSWSFTPTCRGLYPKQSPRVATGFPFGLWEVGRKLDVQRHLLVWPRTFPVGPIPEAAGAHESEGPVARRRAGGQGEILGVRPYRRGDSLRRVHWPQTARQGRMIVCELELTTAPRAQIVLDIDPESHVGEGPDSTLEWAVRVAASLAEGWSAAGAEVEVMAAGLQVRARGGTMESRRAAILDPLAGIRWRPERPTPLAELLDSPLCRAFGEGLRVIVTTDIALAGLGHRPRSLVAERFVVLRASGFGGHGPEPAMDGPRPWIQIDAPERVAESLRCPREEARRAN